MDQLTQQDILDMYGAQVAHMAGGRRRRAPVRRRRGRGLVGGEGFDAMPDLYQSDQRTPSAIDGYVLAGSGLVGGRRRRAPASRKMPASVKAFFAARKRGAAPARRRGRGLVGGAQSMNDLYYEMLDQNGVPPSKYQLKLMQAGVKPETKKEGLIRQIRNMEKKLDIGQSSVEKLKKYNSTALTEILKIYRENGPMLAYPPTMGQSDLFDAGRWEPIGYAEDEAIFSAEPAQRAAKAQTARETYATRWAKA